MAPPRSSGSRHSAAGFAGRAAAGSRRAALAAVAAATAGLLTRVARGVAARALRLLQDDSFLLSSSVHIMLLYCALCWDDSSRAVLAALLLTTGGRWNSDYLQERVGLLMLLRWAASFLLATSSPWVTGTAAAAAHTIAISSRTAMRAGCASSASGRQKVQAMLLLQLLQLAYWLPAAQAVWTIAAALWDSAWSAAPLLHWPALRALGVFALCCERWRLHCELLHMTSLTSFGAGCCQPLLRARSWLADELGRWPLHVVATVVHELSPRAAPHVAVRHSTTLLRVYLRAGAFSPNVHRRDGERLYLFCPTPQCTVAGTVLGFYCVTCLNLVVAGIVFILRVFYLVAAALVGAREGVDTDFVSSCRVLYLEDPPEPDTISTALSTAAGVAATPLHHAMLRVSRRALAIVTWLSRQAAWRQALHFYTLALAGVFTGVPITSAQQLWQPVLAVPGCLLGAAAHFKQLPPLLDLTSVQVGYGGLPITYYVVSCFLGSGSVSWLTGVALVASIVRYGRQLSATPSRTQLEARMVFSLLFWCAAARSAYIVAAAALAAGSFRRVPAALLLNPAVLPQALLLAFAGEAWTRQAVVDCMYSLEDGQKAAATVEAATPPHDASWWPLGACRAALQLTVALLSGEPGRAVVGAGPYLLPFSFRIMLALEDAAVAAGQSDASTLGDVVRPAQADFGSHCKALLAEPAMLMITCVVHLGSAVWLNALRLVTAARSAKRLLQGQTGDAAGPSSPSEWMAAFEQTARGSTRQQQRRPSSHAGGRAATAGQPSGAAPVVFSAGAGAGVAQRPHNRHQRQLHWDQLRQQQQHQQQAETAEAAGGRMGVAGPPAPAPAGAAAAAAAAAAPERPHKQCANCGATSGAGGGKLKKCGGCRRVRYCSAECQAAQWAQHKHACAPVQ